MTLVLCYHAVSDDWDHPLAVHTETLRRQIAAAKKRGIVHVTFDDAYRSILRALPLVERLPTTVFVCTGYAAEGRPIGLAGLDRVPEARRHELATLTWEELRELADRGVEIGSHTRTHPDLRTVSDDALREEVVASREEIEDELGRPCRYLAYPYGQHDERVRLAVERAGYEAAFGLAGVGDRDGSLAIARIELSRNDGPLAVLAKASPLWPLLSPTVRKVRSARARLT